MKLLLDEDVPLPLLALLQHVLTEHQVDHVYSLQWKGKQDRDLYRDARKRRYNAVLTNNLRQLNDPKECTAIKNSGVHLILYQTLDGLLGLALASASICAAIRPLVGQLETRNRQHIGRITSISAATKRFKITDPAIDPPSPYWP
jgi:Domain of unknown function (DUF5615)